MTIELSSAWRRCRRATLAGLAAVGLLLAGCGGGGGGGDTPATGNPPAGGGAPTDGGTPAAKAKWTYLVYIAADNTLSDMAALNIQQMKAANSSADVRVVVQVEQSRQYTQNASATTLRGTVGNGATQFQDLGRNVDMSSRAALAEFVTWGKQAYPADRYAVVLWSHGGGWKADKGGRGALQDLSSRESMMSIKDIAGALADAGGVDLVNFDACLMAMYEVAYELRSVAKVMVGSEEVIPGSGNPYDKVLNRLVANPGMDAATLAKGIVDDYHAYYTATNRDSVALSAIDLTQIDALHGKVKAAAAAMVANMAGERLNIQAARDNSPAYSYQNHHDLVAFATGLAARAANGPLRTAASELAAAAQAAVLANRVLEVPGGLALNGSTGLAIYLPAPADTNTNELSLYQTAMASNVAGSGTTWSEFATSLVTNGGGSTQTTATGPFAYGIQWDNPDVDLDLRVNEPQGNWAGPVEGTTSVNGFSSADSWDSGEAQETYTANSQLERGAYDVFVQYAGCARGKTTCGDTTVSVFRYDPTVGDTAAVLIGTRRMAATPALPSFDTFATFQALIDAANSNAYADWLYVRRITRAVPDAAKVAPGELKRRVKGLGTEVTK